MRARINSCIFLCTVFLVFPYGSFAATSWLNVKDFGAIGDGVADDTAAIQAAINSGGATAQTVYFPYGIFRCGVITLKSNRTLMGEGTLKCANNLSQLAWIVCADINNVVFKAINVNGNKSANTSGPVCVLISNAFDIRIFDCTFTNAAGPAIEISSGNEIKIGSCQFSQGSNSAIVISDSNNTAEQSKCQIYNNTILGFAADAVKVTSSSREIMVSGNAIHHCGNGISVKAAGCAPAVILRGNQIRYTGSWCDQQWYVSGMHSVGRGIEIAKGEECSIISNRIEDSYSFSILLQGCKSCTVSGNVIKGSSIDSGTGEQSGIMVKYWSDSNDVLLDKSQRCSISSNIIEGHRCFGICETSAGGAYNSYMGNICGSNGKDFIVRGTGSVISANSFLTTSELVSDLNGDLKVDLRDFAILAINWLSSN